MCVCICRVGRCSVVYVCMREDVVTCLIICRVRRCSHVCVCVYSTRRMIRLLRSSAMTAIQYLLTLRICTHITAEGVLMCACVCIELFG